MSDIILSICLPTYNRGNILYERIKKWLETDNKNFEIVVSDNCSTDNTIELLHSINDERLKIIENDKNYGGYLNGKKALMAGSGKYIMQLMDKDFIDMKYIDKVIEILKNLDVATGFLVPDSDCENPHVDIISKKLKKIYNFCFKGNHPSGFFFNRELFHKKNAFDVCLDYDKVIRSYITDFITTLLCEDGDVAFIYIPFVFLQRPPFDGIKHSLTYSPENLFFLPENRFKIFEVYLKFLNEIKLNFFERCFVLKKLVINLYYFSTRDYYRVLFDKNICDWYAVPEDFLIQERNKELDKLYIERLVKCVSFNSLLEKIFVVGDFLRWYYLKCKKKDYKNI